MQSPSPASSKNRTTFPLLALLLALAAALPAAAQPQKLTIDPVRSKLTFLLGATGHDVAGSFAIERGELTFDRATGAAGGEIVIDARRGATGSSSRDEKMHAEVLQSVKFPSILFRPEKIEGRLEASGKSRIGLRGKVSLLGIEHELLLPVEVEISGERVVASATFPIPFVAWGLEDPSIFVLKVDKEVQLTLAVEGKLSAAP